MPPRGSYDAIIVGSGPNGLAAAITLAEAGLRTLIVEGAKTIGGGTRSAELTLPGFIHDVCSAILPLTAASPFFHSFPFQKYGVEFITPPVAFAHPLDDQPAVLLEGDVAQTARNLGLDTEAYQRLMGGLVSKLDQILEEFLGTFPFPPRYPWLFLQFSVKALWPATFLARSVFRGERARALFAGLSAHSIQPLEWLATSSFALVAGAIGHRYGWPLIRGGTHALTKAMAAYFIELGGELQVDLPVASLDELPKSKVYLLDVTPRQVIRIAGNRLPNRYLRQLSRYRYGPGVFKVDYAINGPIPWKDEGCKRSATLHIGGTLEEIAESERVVWKGGHPEKPFLILAQQSLFDPSRAPEGKHIVWTYCHVPNGSTFDMTERIENQIERFAPGFRDLILARQVTYPAQMEAYNPNYIGGDINGGVQDIRQLFTRPVPRIIPYSTPAEDIFICSSSTPPGGGVHGMCGRQAAMAALRSKQFRIR
ncbi:MAG: NAD(P)/FAD-dependent oxidoreductase [Anaerolineae bacterium]|nr:NAD(P)/FAD-dependent oxidoreductase [Anaerolineae bacterium]